MTMECTWIAAREEACSDGGSCVPDISILGANAYSNQQASEEVVWTFFLRVGVGTGLLRVTVEGITCGEIGTRHWTGEHISKMYFSLWKTPGVSERMWSANLEASISGEFQTLGGYSVRPSE
jgi:hypothetical protein